MKFDFGTFPRKKFCGFGAFAGAKRASEGPFCAFGPSGSVFEVGEKENLEEIFTPEFHACLHSHQKRIWPEPFLPQELHPQCR